MATTIATVRDTIRQAIETGTGLRTFAWVQDQIVAPCAHVAPLEFDPRLVLSQSKAAYMFQVRVYVSRAAAVEQNQKLLDEYREISGDRSILAAVQDGSHWPGSIVDYCQVTRIGEVLAVDYGGVPYLTVEFDLEVVW